MMNGNISVASQAHSCGQSYASEAIRGSGEGAGPGDLELGAMKRYWGLGAARKVIPPGVMCKLSESIPSVFSHNVLRNEGPHLHNKRHVLLEVLLPLPF